MNRRKFLSTAGALGAGLALNKGHINLPAARSADIMTEEVHEAHPEFRNVLLLVVDQQRADCLGCYGNPVVQTPHLDRLADTGIRFENAFTPTPVCTPARTSLQTGLWAHHHGLRLNTGRFGEYGGGIELVYKAMDAIGRDWSMRGPKTALSQRFVEHVGAKSVDDLLEGISRGRYHIRATDAPLVFECARNGDAVAREAIVWMGRELGNLAVGVIRQLGMEKLAFEVVMSGSFYDGSPLVAEAMQEAIHEVAPGASLVRLDAPPVVGSVMLGMEQVGIDFVPLRERLIASVNRLIENKRSP